ncbi:stress responsive protein [Devosia riboflavina]|uniref:Stress responsive protein n=1 Tax=Devosia riboflavina TaxID=46914 RepID=A0A087M406_9HYPH|nr:Dabb family protein [Devosia riboflavina]KFL31609.1 stress responsive protein [Devosia riboflavina]
MIRHCVLVRFRPEVTQQDRTAIYAELESLREVVPGFLAMSAGPNVSPEGVHQGFVDGFTMDFIDEAARDAYLIHPDHKAAGAKLVASLEGGRDGLIVFDMVV